MGTEQDTLPSVGVGGSGAAATSGGIAAGEKGQAAGGNIYNIDNLNVGANPEALRWLVMKGIVPLMDMVGAPEQPWDLDFQGREHISTLRRKLLRIKELKHPKLITVRGTLFPCALLSPETSSAAKHPEELGAGRPICSTCQHRLQMLDFAVLTRASFRRAI